MTKFLGETVVPVEQSPFAGFNTNDWILYFLERWGSVDGAHHKADLLDQIAQIAHGTAVEIRRAKWSSGKGEWRVSLPDPSSAYKAWVKRHPLKEED